MSPSLEARIRRHVARVADLAVLDAEEAERLTEVLARKFIKDSSRRWWWEALKEPPAAVIEYGTDDGLMRVAELLRGASDAVLVVTDDESPPWLAIRGSVSALVALLKKHRWFEYLITDTSGSFVIFDTHHNTLVVVGLGGDDLSMRLPRAAHENPAPIE